LSKFQLVSNVTKCQLLPKPEHQDETLEQCKTRLVVQREWARLGMCNLHQRRRVEEPREQREARLAVEREIKKRRRVEELPEQRETRLAADREGKKRKFVAVCVAESVIERILSFYNLQLCAIFRCSSISVKFKIYHYLAEMPFEIIFVRFFYLRVCGSFGPQY